MDDKLRQQLHDQVVVITGASSGIGAVLATTFLEYGACVALIARRSHLLRAFEQQYSPNYCLTCVADVCSYKQIHQSIERVITKWQRIHILINNAGVYPPEVPLWQQSTADWHTTLDVNLNGVFHLCRAVLPYMIESGYGRIINVSSAMTAVPNSLVYSLSKQAVDTLSSILAHELEQIDTDILVNSIDPGSVFSEMNAEGPLPTESVIPRFLQLATLPKGNKHGLKWSAQSDT